MPQPFSIRGKVEHPFRIVKHQLGYQAARYRELPKNIAQITIFCGLRNLWMARKLVLASG